ncbi:TIGR02391 family protein [Microbacterium testaceum]|uniref:TIGR02391 family protein n=1 Tax=Microbacterium testaceum TaxID=2033 RepID=UPI003813981F
MNTEWAVGVLDWWVKTALSSRAFENDPFSGHGEVKGWVKASHPSLPNLREREYQTRRVLATVLELDELPVILHRDTDGDYWVATGIDLATYAIGRLRTEAETSANLGSSAPSMAADALHPLVWEAASKRWDAGHFSDAVQRAATFLNAHVQDISGRRDVSDSELMREVFSMGDAAQGKPRLRWPGEDNDLTVKTMRVGILNMAQGVFSAIRNPATHSTEDMERQEALEQLATLSILARWIDRCEVVVAS